MQKKLDENEGTISTSLGDGQQHAGTDSNPPVNPKRKSPILFKALRRKIKE
jgi:hypothetical protein